MKYDSSQFMAAILIALSLTGLTACSGSSSKAAPAATPTQAAALLPLLTPVVKASIPSGLGGTAAVQARSKIQHLFASETVTGAALTSQTSALTDRFFSTSGPSQIVASLMPQMDNLISNVNTMASSSTSACLTQTPIGYALTVPGGTVQMYAQCYTQGTSSFAAVTHDGVTSPADPAFMQFGIKDGVIYIWTAWAAEWVGAIITPITGGGYSVTAYLGLGYGNNSAGHWDTMSYGLMEFNANSSAGTFELAVAGLGFGYCGGQLSSDGTNIYASLSSDMGQTCGTNVSSTYYTDDLCVKASDLSASTGCSTTFNLTPIGRLASTSTAASVAGGNPWAASTYSPNITVDGTATDTIHILGPTAPTTGVGEITAGNTGGGGAPSVSNIVDAIETGGSGGCTISSSAATTAANAAITAFGTNQSQTDAITALNASLTSSGFSGQITCADNALSN